MASPGIALPASKDLDLEGLDVDGLLNFFNQADNRLAPSVDPSLLMNAHFGLPAGPAVFQPGNLFDSLPAAGGHRPRDSSAESTGDQDDARPAKSAKTSQAKAIAVQEKNRRAQKRFRERQKARMKDMTESLDDMGDELSKLRLENGTLKHRNNILEKVLSLRDEHIRVLQDEQQVFDLGSHFTQSNSLRLTAVSAGSTMSPSGARAVSAADARAVRSLPAEGVISRWKETVRELGNVLVQVESCPDEQDTRHQQAMAELSKILDAASQLCMHTAVLHPTNMQRLIATTLDEGRSRVDAEDRSRWEAIASALALSEEQVSQLQALRLIFLRRMAKVSQERSSIVSRLHMVTIPDRMMALQSVIAETLKVNECTSRLKSNLQEEHLAGMEFLGTAFKTVLSPLQKARAIVQSYPFYPDIYQIATALAGDSSGKNVYEVLEQGAQAVLAGDGATPIGFPTIYSPLS